MKITAERFAALLSGSATDVTGEERVARVEAFTAERRGEDPVIAVQARLPHVMIVEAVQVKRPMNTAATNIAPVSSASLPSGMSDQGRTLNRLCWLALAGLAIAVSWSAASGGLVAVVGHFIAAAVGGVLVQGVVWFFRAPKQ